MAKNNKSIPWFFVLGIIIFSYLYAIIRYHYFGNAPVKDFPLYITNKVLAISSVILFVTFILKKNSLIGGLSYIFALGHLLISLLILSPVYYKKFFTNDFELNGIANLSLLAGVFSFLGLWVYHQIKKGNTQYKIFSNLSIQYFILGTLFMHLFFMGFKEWLHPLSWKAYLPPISLIAGILVLVGFFKK